MIYHHPPSEGIRQTISDFRADSSPTPSMHNSSCACCRAPKPASNLKELKVLAIIVFAVTAVLVGLNAYQRERIENDLAQAPAPSAGGVISARNLGPGASQAAELSFPTKTPTQVDNFAYGPMETPDQHQYADQQYAMVPIQQVRPGEPVLQFMAVPLNDGRGTIRLKRVVGR